MPRIARILPEEGVLHILTRGNNQQWIFHNDQDFKYYLKLLRSYKSKHSFFLYHYCLMNNHIHLILEMTLKTNLASFMKGLNLSYFSYYKRKYGYIGHFWQGRFKSLLIEKDKYLLACGIYIERNPVRAKIVKRPKDYPYSSYNFYALGEKNLLLNVDPLYEDLGRGKKERQENYKTFFLENKGDNIKHKIFNGRFLGSDSFVKKMKEKFRVKDIRQGRGRPRKEKTIK